MKTDTREYDDGTEPDVYRRWCCDGKCEQGRLCPKNMPAEAATDVGQEPNFYGREFLLEELGALVVWGIGVVALVGLVAFLVGRYV
jgi:hypothetical protein